MSDIIILSKTILKEQATVILGDNPGMSRDEAYGKALEHTIAVQCEQYAFDDPFKALLLTTLESLGGKTRPVPIKRIAAETGGSEWQVWYHMSAMRDELGIVRMVGKRGWMSQAA